MTEFTISTSERNALIQALELTVIPGILGLPAADNIATAEDFIVDNVPDIGGVTAGTLGPMVRTAIQASNPSTINDLVPATLAGVVIQSGLDLSSSSLTSAEFEAALTSTLDGLLSGIKGGLEKAPLIAAAIATPVADAVEGWIQKLVSNLKANNVPVSALGSTAEEEVAVTLTLGTVDVEYVSQIACEASP